MQRKFVTYPNYVWSATLIKIQPTPKYSIMAWLAETRSQNGGSGDRIRYVGMKISGTRDVRQASFRCMRFEARSWNMCTLESLGVPRSSEIMDLVSYLRYEWLFWWQESVLDTIFATIFESETGESYCSLWAVRIGFFPIKEPLISIDGWCKIVGYSHIDRDDPCSGSRGVYAKARRGQLSLRTKDAFLEDW